MDLWDEREKQSIPDQVYQDRIGLITEFYELAKGIIRDNGGEVYS